MDESEWRSKLYQWLALDQTKKAPDPPAERLRFGAIKGAFAAVHGLSNRLIDQETASSAEMAIAAVHNAGALLATAFQSRQISEEDVRRLFEQALNHALRIR